jgi:hypothetical protein
MSEGPVDIKKVTLAMILNGETTGQFSRDEFRKFVEKVITYTCFVSTTFTIEHVERVSLLLKFN